MVLPQLLYLIGVCAFQIVFGVPAGNDSNVADNLASQMATVRNTMEVLSGQWEKWNTLFITSLEPRITSTASTLSSIDSNIHNLQERAHVWDTFQHHVAAWNDQLASLDRKMTILSKGIEQLTSIESKLNTILSEEYKLEKLIKMVNSLTGSVVDIKQFCKSTGDSLFEEFAARGILSSLKLIEQKVDKLFTTKQNIGSNRILNQDNISKCNIPKETENILSDISSKVDTIFDELYKKIENDYLEDYLDVKDMEGSGSELPVKANKLRAVKRGLYSTQRDSCCHSVEHHFKELNSNMLTMEHNLISIMDNFTRKASSENSKTCEKSEIEDFLRKVTYNASVDQSVNMNLILESYFNENRAHLLSMFENYSSKSCLKMKTEDFVSTTTVISEETETYDFNKDYMEPNVIDQYNKKSKTFFEEGAINVKHPSIIVNRTSCDDLESDSTSGVYLFKNSYGDFVTERFFNKQYCEVRDDGLWTVIQRRDNYSTQHDFNVSWNDYKLGFGDLNEDFWIGNNFLARLSKIYDLTLRIELGDFDGNQVWAEYKSFKVDGEESQFKLTVGRYSGNSSDALSSHSGAPFSTYDRKNDDAPDCCPCSVSYGGGWWFTRCFESNLNGIYYRKPYENDHFRGIIWEHWLGNYSLKKSIMLIKYKGLTRSYTPNITQIEEP